MTDDGMDRFWEQLRERTRDPAQFTVLSDAEAERRMAEAEEVPMSEEEIAAIVREAAGGAGGESRPREHRDIEPPQARFWLAAAATILGSVLLIAAVTVALWPGRHSTRTLPYAEAFHYLLDPGEVEARRRSAMSRISTRAIAAIQVLQDVRSEQNEVGASSNRILDSLRELIRGERKLEISDEALVRAIREPIGELCAFVRDTDKPRAARIRKLEVLAEQVRLGILALKKVRFEVPPPPPGMAADVKTFLDILKGRLGSD